MEGPDFEGFDWDADKSERGFDFDYAALIFEGDFIQWEDRRHKYGEQRFVSVGKVEDNVLAVVWTPRDKTRRIISARPASRLERKQLYAEREAHQEKGS